MNNFSNYDGTDGDWDMVSNPYMGPLQATNIFCPGYIAANRISSPGGNAFQYLMADGSTSTKSGGNNGSNIYAYSNSISISGIPSSGFL